MSRLADFTIYILGGLLVLAVLIAFFGHSNHTAVIFFRVLEFSMFALLTWAVLVSCRKHQWWMATLGVLCGVIIASQILAPHDSPLGRHEVGFVIIVPLVMFENASAKGQKIAVVLGSLLASAIVVVNAGVVGFGTAANTISGIVVATLLALVVLRYTSAGRHPRTAG